MLQVINLEWEASFLWSFYHVAGVGRKACKNLPANAGRLVPVPEEMSQTLLTNQRHGKIYQIHAAGIIKPT
jgi:hypothetical protein